MAASRRAQAGHPPWSDERVRALLWDRLREASVHAVAGAPADLDLDTLGLSSLTFIDLTTAVTLQFGLQRTGLDRRLTQARRLAAWVELIRESLARDASRLGFLTSGSSGVPKLCEHPLAWLEQEVAFFAARLAGARRVCRLVPLHHIYGFLFGLLLPARLELPVHDWRALAPTALTRAARPGDLLVAHPLVLDLATRAPARFPPGVTVLTSTAPCPPPLWQRLEAAGAARILDIHGASETAGIGWREAATAPFRLLPHWQRDAAASTRLRRRPPDSPMDPTTAELDNEPAFALPDRLAWVDAHHFHVLGREDQAIQIGGVNVFPERVRACLAAHPEVAEARVRVAGAPPDIWLKALVVPRADVQDARANPARWLAELDTWLAARLSPAECPRRITLADQAPVTALGKAADWDHGIEP